MSELRTGALAVLGAGAGAVALNIGGSREIIQDTESIPESVFETLNRANRLSESALQTAQGAVSQVGEVAEGQSEGFAEVVQAGSSGVSGAGESVSDLPEAIREQLPDRPDTEDIINLPEFDPSVDFDSADLGQRIGGGIVDFHRGVAEGGADGWQRVLDEVTDGRGTNIRQRDLEGNIDALADWGKDRLDPTTQADALDQGGRIGESVSESVSSTASSVSSSVSSGVSEASEKVSESTENVRDTIEESTSNIDETVSEASERASESVDKVRDSAEDAVDNVRDRIGGVFG